MIFLQCLQADDIATAVVYVLSAPPHVQVSWTHSVVLDWVHHYKRFFVFALFAISEFTLKATC